MWKCPQGVHAFMRAYYHHKSADWKQNQPFPLKSWTASELEKMPTYYIMDLNEGMAETVAKEMPSASEIAANKWLPDNELAVYAAEYGRNGYQGGLQWYRCTTSGRNAAELQIFSGRTIDVPSCFIAGKSDWGNLPATRRRHDQDAEGRADEHAGLPSGGWRGTLGAAGTAGESE